MKPGHWALTLVLTLAARSEVIYRESFDRDVEGWKTGKNRTAKVDRETWHRNMLGFWGGGESLEWHATGGRSDGYGSTRSPWYFDDNHGEFYWFHLIAQRPYLSRDGLTAGKDLRKATVKVSLRGRNFKLNGAKLFFWLEGPPSGASGLPDIYRCWAFTEQSFEQSLLDGKWHDLEFQLANDESKWSFMGLINGGLKRKIRVVQPISSGDGTLDATLGSGKVYVWGFILAGIDPVDLPTGIFDIDEFSVVTKN